MTLFLRHYHAYHGTQQIVSLHVLISKNIFEPKTVEEGRYSYFNLLSTNPTKWSTTLKQFVG